jgi:hypothetical protein
MSNAVYEIATVRLKVLSHLRARGSATAAKLSEDLGIPVWAIEPALESAEVGGLALRSDDGLWVIPARVSA